jgi:hypothetical protein
LQEGANEESQEKSIKHYVMLMGFDREESEDAGQKVSYWIKGNFGLLEKSELEEG